MPRSTLVMAPSEVHVWYVRLESPVRESTLTTFRGLMNAEERSREAGYRFDRHRHEYTVTRALARTTLSRYAAVDPRAWVFRSNAFGKPEIASPIPTIPLQFNLSNTDGMVVCAVTSGRDVGIDVESLRRLGPTVEIAEQYFAPREILDLRALAADAQPERFVAYWTLKEAYVKARGMGLSIPLDQFAYTIDDRGAIRITFEPSVGDDSRLWQFARYSPTQAHRLAIAVHRAADESVSVLVRELEIDSLAIDKD